MTTAGNFHPEIKFRWCRSVACRTQEVWLVLTSVTGTRVRLTWQPHLGWYEAPPTPLPCGLHTGFILINDKVRDTITGSLRSRERDYKVDPFHIVPHKFAVELFLESDQTSPFWSDVPELRLRYLSSDHLERLITTHQDSTIGQESGGLHGRKWVSSTSLSNAGDRGRTEEKSSSISKGFTGTYAKGNVPPGGLTRGRSHNQLTLSSTSLGNLRDQGEASVSSPNLSRAFQVAVDLSHASSKFLAGLSSTSSGVCLGFEDGSEPPSPDTKDSAHINSPYAAGGETSQDSEDAGEGARRKKSLYSSRDRSLHIEDLAGEEPWRRKQERSKRADGSNASSASFEELLATVSATRRATFKSELNLLRFDTLAQERLVKEILAPSDSDFEDEEAACEASDSDFAGHYGCVITFESRSSSMDDVGSPRALEDVLVSLTSNESHPEFNFEISHPEPPSSVKEHDSESILETSSSEGRQQSQPKPATVTPASCSKPSSLENMLLSVPVGVNKSPVCEPVTSDESCAVRLNHPSNTVLPYEEDHEESDQYNASGESTDGGPENEAETQGSRLVTNYPCTTPDIEEDVNFQYESLKHEDEHFPIDIRNIDSEDSLEGAVCKTHVGYALAGEEPLSQADSSAGESGRSGSYDVGVAQPTFSSMDGEVPTNSLNLVPKHSQRGTVREAKYFEYFRNNKMLPKEEKKNETETEKRKKVGENYDLPKTSEFVVQEIQDDLLGEAQDDHSGAAPPTDGERDGARPSPSGDEARPSPNGDGARPSPSGDEARPSPNGDGARTCPSEDGARTCPNGEGVNTCPSGEGAQTSKGGDEGRTFIGGDERRTFIGSDVGKTYPSGDRERTFTGGDEDKTCLSDEGRTFKDGDEDRTCLSGNEGRTFMGGDESRTFTCDDENGTFTGGNGSRTFTDGDGSRTFTGGNGGKTFTGGDGGKTFTGGDGGRTFTGGDGGRTFTGGDGGRTFTNSDGSRTFTGSDGGRTYPSIDGKRTFTVGYEGRTFTSVDGGRTYPSADGGKTFTVGYEGRTLTSGDGGRTYPSADGRRTFTVGFEGRTSTDGDEGKTVTDDGERGFGHERRMTEGAGSSTVRREETVSTRARHHPPHDRDSGTRQPRLRPVRLHNAATQTSQKRLTTQATSTRPHQFGESEGVPTSPGSKYSRSPLRSRTSGQAEVPYSPLPDRLSGPWSQRTSRGVPTAPQPPHNPDLSVLQRNLYGLVQGQEPSHLHHNTLLLRALQTEVLQRRSQQAAHLPHQAHLSSAGAHHTQHHHHHHHSSPTHHHHHSSPVHYRYPVLDSSMVQSSSSLAWHSTQPAAGASYGAGGSTSHLGTRRHQRHTSFQHLGGGGAGGGVRGTSSLPDLYNTAASTYPGHSRPTPTAHTTTDLRRTHLTHAHSAVDLMVGSGRSAGLMGKHWDNESDSGGSTDSLIDEAEHVTTTPLDPHVFSVYPPMHGWDVQHRKQHRQRRRRTRSHHGGFSAWRGEAEGAGSGRPYLPYRSDQLSPGQQVKVIAPGGGVAVARVLTNKKSSWLLADKSLRDSSVSGSSAATITVILLSEPNRLQGSVVTIPLEKVLLAWPTT